MPLITFTLTVPNSMCGIAGIVDFRGRAVDDGMLRAMAGCLAHRGPDDVGTWHHQADGFSVGFAHTRLAVIDPSADAHQPMIHGAGRYAITYNGELYNFRQLRERLPGPFRTQSDTEVALRACAEWGPDAIGHFDAMWAMAFVDTAGRCGHLSRDPFGIKPLYYAFHDHRLVFASELSAIRRVPDLPLEIDPDGVAVYLNLGFIPHPRSIYRGVSKLPPGHRLCFEADRPRDPEPYHKPVGSGGADTAAERHVPSFDEAARQVRERVESAVLSQRIADVPLGAFLSGGIDSSIVVACLARAGARPIQTFSIGYADHPRYDETAYARLVARHLGTEHHAFQLTFRDVLEIVEPVLDHLGEPFADSSLMPTSLVSRYTREHVIVALSGDGGDELFGGYWRYLGHAYLERYRRLPGLLRKGMIEPLLRLLPSARSTPSLDRLRQARKLLRGDHPDPIDRHLAWARIMDDNIAAGLLGEHRASRALNELRDAYRRAASGNASGSPLSPSSVLNGILRADMAIGLPADMLHKVDIASMLHGLEVRVPLLSRDLVEYVTSLPIEYRIQGKQTKRVLRAAFCDVLPAAVIQRGKMGFEVPVGEFLRRELADLYRDTVTSGSLRDLGIDPPTAQAAYTDHAGRRADHTELLWSLLVLCGWHRRLGA